MPPFSSAAGSGTARTAQRTSSNSATTGIFKKTSSQMKVQVSTAIDGTTRPNGRQHPPKRTRVRATGVWEDSAGKPPE